MTNPWQWWPAETIARATGCPAANVAEHWPLIYAALDRRGMAERDVALGVLPTVAIETASRFLPIHEFTDWSRYPDSGGYPPHYEGGPEFHGRGYIQLTHMSGYRAAGAALGLDLVSNPDLALVPEHAADILAWFWATKGVPARDGSRWWSLVDLCRAHDWEWTRRVVQGGTAGLDRLVAIATALDASKEDTMPTYDPTFPAIAQNDQWSCAPTSLRWALWSLGRQPTEAWIESTMQTERVVSQGQGLLDASGAGLVAFVERQYGEDGFKARNVGSVSFDDVMAVAGKSPVLLGGRRWGAEGHWSGVRGYDAAQDLLLLANPASGYAGIGQTMSRAQFAAVAPASMVVITNTGASASGPSSEAPKTADTIFAFAQPGQVGSGLLAMMTEDGTAPALPSTWLPMGSQSATVEECIGLNGVRYVYHLPTGQRWRYPAA